jgi:hypothetical protein
VASEKQGREQAARRILFWTYAARLAGSQALGPTGATTDAERLAHVVASLTPEQRAHAEKMWETAHAFALNA